MSTRVVLKSEKDRAKLAAGTPLTELGITEEVIDEAPNATELSGDPAPAGADADADAGDTVVTEPVLDGGSKLAAPPPNGEDGLTTYLRNEVTELKEQNTKLTADLADANAAKEKAEQGAATAATMRPALETSIERLQVALGHRALKLEGLPVDSLVNLFDQLNTELMGFPVGQKTVQTDAPRDAADEGATSMEEYRLRMIPKTA